MKKICYICKNGRQCINGVYCLHRKRYMEYRVVEWCSEFGQTGTTEVEAFGGGDCGNAAEDLGS